MQAKYLTKRQKGGGFLANLQQVEVLPVEYSSLSYYNERLMNLFSARKTEFILEHDPPDKKISALDTRFFCTNIGHF